MKTPKIPNSCDGRIEEIGLLDKLYLGCPIKHKTSQIILDMDILDPFNIKGAPEFSQEFHRISTIQDFAS